ncbi:MAG TPA: alginate lyase family protein [Bacteroidota bacterium]
MSLAPLGLVALLMLSPPPGAAQLTFSDSSRLRDSSFLEHRVKEVDDADLWSSLDLDRKGLNPVRRAARTARYADAATAWSAYWAAKPAPVYLTRLDHLLQDTDILTPADSFRAAIDASAEERDGVLAAAEPLLRNTIRAWGDSIIAFGDTVDFNRPIGRSGKYGFHYWWWSRPLLMAAALTGDRKYLEKFEWLFNTWYVQRNRVTRTIADLDPVYYELGLATRDRIFIEFYLLNKSHCAPETHRRILKTMLGAARWLYEIQRWEGYRPGNWQIWGAYTLTQIALVFPEFREASSWLAVGLQRLTEHLRRDFFPDGGHSERSPQNYTLATYLNYRNLAFLLATYAAAEPLRREIKASMGRTIDWWIAMIAPTGEVPAINDSWRGLFPTMILRDGAAFYNKPEALAILHRLRGDGSAPDTVLPPFTSRHMPASGFTVMRTDWTPQAFYLTLNYGPFAGFHTHKDLLDFEIYANGKPLALDAGLGLTYDDSLYLPWYQSSRAHNMVVVNDSSVQRDGFQGENIRWASIPALDYFAGTHRGYQRFGVTHRRQVAFIKDSSTGASPYWFVLDDLSCARSGDTLSWYFHTPEQLEPFGAGFASRTAPGIRILPAGAHLTARRGEGWAAATHNRTPGKTELLPWIRFDQVGVKDSTKQFALLLDPFRDAAAVRSVERISARHYAVRSPDGEDHLYFTAGGYREGGLDTDGDCVLIALRKGKPLRFAIAHGTYLRYGGKSLWLSAAAGSGEGTLTR